MSIFSEAVAVAVRIADGDVRETQDIENQYWWRDVCAALEELGFAPLGSGHFSGAWYHAATDKVLKIGFKPGIDSGLAYAQWARANQMLVGVPVVYELGQYSGCWFMVTKQYSVYPANPSLHPRYCSRVSDAMDYYLDTLDEHNVIVQEHLQAMPELFQTLGAIHAYFVGTANFDLHKKNVMWDGDFPIINDPTSYQAGCSGYYAWNSGT